MLRDLKEEFKTAKVGKILVLKEHIDDGGRVAVTTDCQTARGNKEYMTVTVYITTKARDTVSWVLDLVHLTKAYHSAKYLCEELQKVTEDFGISQSVIAIT